MMRRADKWFLYVMVGGTILLGAAMMVSAQPASAQCGTAASSCKNCHETQAKMPVANNGDWHKAHAFGDFCEFCHAGNVQATVKEEAHTGLVAPLEDVKTSCQGCHPGDYDKMAQTYASTLGVDLTTVGSANPATTSGNGDSSSCASAVSAPLGGEQIDFNLLYTETATKTLLVSNWGNLILELLIVIVATAFFMTAWSWENWGQKTADWLNRNITPLPQALAAAVARSDGEMISTNAVQVQTLLAQKPELRKLLPRLMKLQPETLATLDTILANSERGGEILSVMSRVDAEVVAALSQIKIKDRDTLLRLIREIG